MRALFLALVLAGLVLSISVRAIAAPTSVASERVAAYGRPPAQDSSHGPGRSLQTGINGTINISNIQPLCAVPTNGSGIVPSPRTTTEVVVTSQSGTETFVPVNWSIVDQCILLGTFQVRLLPGTYSLTLSYCLGSTPGEYSPPGCPNAACGPQSCNLPITVVVKPGELSPVSIGITTGIY
jgi:hypothetical protein